MSGDKYGRVTISFPVALKMAAAKHAAARGTTLSALLATLVRAELKQAGIDPPDPPPPPVRAKRGKR